MLSEGKWIDGEGADGMIKKGKRLEGKGWERK